MKGGGSKPEQVARAIFDIPHSAPERFPPLMSLSGQRLSQEAKCPAVGHLVMSRPTSLNSGNAFSSKPGI
jgi:hypothetical protein